MQKQNIVPMSTADVLNAFDNAEREVKALSIALQRSRIDLAAARAILRKVAAVPGVPAALLAQLRGLTSFQLALPNSNRLSLKEWLQQEEMTLDELLDSGTLADSVVPALCKEGCEVEPDGKCQHGCPAITIALGVI